MIVSYAVTMSSNGAGHIVLDYDRSLAIWACNGEEKFP